MIPQAVVAREDAMRLARTVAAYPGKVRVRFSMPNKIGGPIEQFNVIGEIRGREKPDEAVILGAHLDSWDLGTGALDNGCNAAMVIEAARAIRATGLVPRRTIRFALFSGEEQGMVGSWQYVAAHRAEMDKIRGVIIFDSGVGRVSGYSLSGRRDIRDGLAGNTQAVELVGCESSYARRRYLERTTGIFSSTACPRWSRTRRRRIICRTITRPPTRCDKVDMRELKINTVIAAVTAWGVADRAEPLGKRLSRAEIETATQGHGSRRKNEAARRLGRLAKRHARPQTVVPEL